MSEQAFDSGIPFENSFHDQLAGSYVSCLGEKAPNPSLLKLNEELASALGLHDALLSSDPQRRAKIAAMFSGGTAPKRSKPLAQAYAGHQFGGFNPQLGDGRAVLLGEVVGPDNERVDIQLKGAGRTIFSRSGDGKAALGPVLREYLVAEAMHSLGVPTTRALAITTTGESVIRETVLKGAVLVRTAASHVRVGTFQYLAARDDNEAIRKLADYCIDRHYREVSSEQNPYLAFFEAVCNKQAQLVAKWMSLGFVHGVMNTDNMTISGETIDYGPCAFIDQFDPSIVFSSIDRQGRYAYQNQPTMALWNLARLAETLLALISDDEEHAIELVRAVLDKFDAVYKEHWLACMRPKLGLDNKDEQDEALINELLTLMAQQKVDYTQTFRALIKIAQGDPKIARSLFSQASNFYLWLMKWQQRLAMNDQPGFKVIDKMTAVNPVYIARNHQVEAVIEAAQERGDFQPFEKLLSLVTNPFTEQEGCEEFAQAAPEEFGHYTTYCGT